VTTLGIVSPGAMGSALGRAWAATGHQVVATVHGRSERTQRLARGLELLPSLEEVVATADVVVDICPPGEAHACLTSVLEAVAGTGARPLLADLNAIAPGLVRELAARARDAGVDLVDGALSGGPPQPGGETMLYLSGPRAAEIARLPADGLRRRVVGREVGVASAVKMCTASVYKGTTALWIQALETADRHGVADVVLDDLAEAFPDEVAGAARRVGLAVSKSDRFVAEMEHIAATQAEAGASGELFTGIAAVYRRLSHSGLARLSPEEAAALTDLRDVLRRLPNPTSAG
jgi:3-hydroxyisobutyrate dehydrogenase-like beta-hydroxyacid dehydrogenase